MHNRKYYMWISFMIDQLVRSYIVIGWICEKMWFIKLPTENTFVVTLGAFVKCFCESLSFPQKCIRSYIGCIWSRASQENRIRFVNLMVCFDLLSPKFLIMRARQLKKGEQNGISMVVTCMPEKMKMKTNSPQISLTAAAGCWQAYPCCPSWVWPHLTFSLLISELFILKAIGASFHFHCQLPTEAYEDFQSFIFTFLK